MQNKRKIKDIILQSITYIFSSFGILILVAIFVFIFSKGATTLSFDMITGDYHQEVYNLTYEEKNVANLEEKNVENSYYSTRWGIALQDGTNNAGENVVYVSYIDENSCLRGLKDQTTASPFALKKGYIVTKIILLDEEDNMIISISKYKAEKMINQINKGVSITDMQITTSGGGIRGSLLTTLLLIFLTLIISLPLGIGGAIYLAEYAKNNKLTTIIRAMIDMSSGIPSVIFGLVGMLIFIPFMNATIHSSGTSVAAGAITMAIMLLPIIIRTTEEAIHTIPQSYRNASLALGASKTQTIFKVVIPNALGGILTATLLSIGRIIGESAALIYVMGTAIKDTVAINQNSTSLAVHMWSVMAGENPNYAQACAIAIIILIIVLILNILVKLISRKLNKFEVKK